MVHRIPKKGYFKISRKARRRFKTTRCWLNGEEVTTRCFYADPRRGIVKMFVRGADGRPIVDWTRDRALVETRRGRVRCHAGRKKAS